MIIEIRASDSVMYQEYPIYPISLLLSDIGGIAGLVMGINLVHIISTSSCLWDLTTQTVALLSESSSTRRQILIKQIEYVEGVIRVSRKQWKRERVYIKRTQL